MSGQSSSKPSLASFGYKGHTLASAGIRADETPWRRLPTDLYREIQALLDFHGTVPPDTALVRLS